MITRQAAHRFVRGKVESQGDRTVLILRTFRNGSPIEKQGANTYIHSKALRCLFL
jgi:hypothetical protein